MAQNPEKYYYINRVGLVRDSWAHKMFEKDAATHHMEEQPGKLVALRLTEYYELIERMGGAWNVPGASTIAAATNGAIANGATPTAKRPGRKSSSQATEEKREEEQEDPDQALDDSIDYWTSQ